MQLTGFASVTELELEILVSYKNGPQSPSRKEADDWRDFRRKEQRVAVAPLARLADRTPEPAERSRVGQEVPIERHHGSGVVAWHVNQCSGQ
jgi:hypothetical protein